MPITMYDLAGADPAVRFSPYCWRTRMALAHKGLEAETIPWRFSDKPMIGFSGQGRVPVIKDGDRVAFDSWAIACDLEAHYPDRPSLFGGAGGEAAMKFLNTWADNVLNAGIVRLVLLDIYTSLAPQDQLYFRKSREERFGTTLEAVQGERDKLLPGFRASLQPVRSMLSVQPWLGGAQPNYADYIVFGCLQWPRVISAYPLLATDDTLRSWMERVLDLHGGLARATPAKGA